jgi:hypothetical protein
MKFKKGKVNVPTVVSEMVGKMVMEKYNKMTAEGVPLEKILTTLYLSGINDAMETVMDWDDIPDLGSRND